MSHTTATVILLAIIVGPLVLLEMLLLGMLVIAMFDRSDERDG